MEFHVTELMSMSEQDIWHILPQVKCNVTFSDGVVKTTSERIKISWYTWLLNKELNIVPTSKQIIQMTEFSKGDDVKLHNAALDTCYYATVERYPEMCPRELYEQCIEITMFAKNRMYNAVSMRLNAYVNSLSYIDFVEILLDERLMSDAMNIQDNQESILESIELAKKELDDLRFEHNAIARYLRRKMVRKEQAIQMIHVRGATTAINSDIYPHAILSCYARGIRDAGYSAIETVQSTKATLFQKAPMKKSEYFHRQMQLMMMYLSSTVGSMRIGVERTLLESKGDCGTTERITVSITKRKQIEMLSGLLYNVDGDPTQRMMLGTEKLIGKTVYVRTPLNCNTDQRGKVCACCLGMFSNTIPEGANIGLLSAAETIEKIVQAVLGIKHSEGTAEMRRIDLTAKTKDYFKIGPKSRSFYFHDKLKQAKPTLTFKCRYAPDLPDIMDSDLATAVKIGEIPSIYMHYTEADGTMKRTILPTNLSSTCSHLTEELIQYIRKYNFGIDNVKEEYSISLEHWDWSKPFLQLESKHVSMLDLLAQIASFVKGGRESESNVNLRTLRQIHDKSDALNSFYELVTEHISVNYVHLAMMIKSTMCLGDYRGPGANFQIPLLSEPYRFEQFPNLMSNRSIGQLMPFEHQKKPMHDWNSYIPGQRPAHPYDAFFEQY